MRWLAPALAAVPLSLTATAQGPAAEFRFPGSPIGPQTVALGGVAVALAADAETARNPAGLLAAPHLSVHHFEGFADYSGSVVAASLSLFNRAAIGVSVRRFGWDHVIEDDLGSGTAGLDVSETRLKLTVAALPAPALRVGVAISRMVADNLGSRTVATSLSLGAIVRYARGGTIGLVLQDAGAPAAATDVGATYPLPTRLRAGVAQRFELLNSAVVLALDLEQSPHGGSFTELAGGTSVELSRLLVLRAGYSNAENLDVGSGRTGRWSAGLGLVVGDLELGFAFRFGAPTGGYETFVGLDAFRPSRPQM